MNWYAEAHIEWVKNVKLIHCLMSNQFFLSWLFSWEFGKEIFSQNWKEEWNKEIHCSKKNSLFITQVISFLDLKHVIESRGVSVMLNLFFYVFKGIVKWAESCKCVISRILWHKRINPSLKEWRFWYLILTGEFPP